MLHKNVRMTGSKSQLYNWLVTTNHTPNFETAWTLAGRMVGERQHTVQKWQGLLLYQLAAQYNELGANILELGTHHGHSVALIAQAAPFARIVTVEQNSAHVQTAIANLRKVGLDNVRVVNMTTDQYLLYTERPLSLVFHDAAHYEDVYAELAYFQYIEPEGLALFHDFSPKYPDVIAAVESLGTDFAFTGHEANGKGRHGMAGVYK